MSEATAEVPPEGVAIWHEGVQINLRTTTVSEIDDALSTICALHQGTYQGPFGKTKITMPRQYFLAWCDKLLDYRLTLSP